CLGVDDLARGGEGVTAVEAERHPAGLFAQLDADSLFRWHHRGIEDVQGAVVRVTDPKLLLVRRQADAVARAAMPLDRPLLVTFHLHPVQNLSPLQVADLEAE